MTKSKKDEDPTLFEKYNYPVIYPEMTIEITVFNNEGVIPVSKWIGTSTPQYPLPVNDYLLKGFDNKEMVILPAEDHQDDNLYLMLDRAIHNTIQNYLSQ